MQSKLYLVSFGNNDYYIRLSHYLINKLNKRYKKSISLVFTTKDLPEDMLKFCQAHSKGFGFFTWKPYIIYQTLLRMNENDVMFYVDGRTYYNGASVNFIDDFILNPNLDGLFWRMDNVFEYQYSKGDYFRILDAREQGIVNSEQYAATFLLIRKNERTMELIRNWKDTLIENKELLINNSSITPNLDGFIENRHDQAFLSILIKKSLALRIINLTSSDVSNSPIKPHSLPHKHELPKISYFFPLGLVRVLYLIKRIGFKGIFANIIKD
jgi:hypothetical protein